jgi:hypothetical protein
MLIVRDFVFLACCKNRKAEGSKEAQWPRIFAIVTTSKRPENLRR